MGDFESIDKKALKPRGEESRGYWILSKKRKNVSTSRYKIGTQPPSATGGQCIRSDPSGQQNASPTTNDRLYETYQIRIRSVETRPAICAGSGATLAGTAEGGKMEADLQTEEVGKRTPL